MLTRDEINARALRLSGRAPNRYTGTANDPFQEAQHIYAGPGWEQFFGSLAKQEEDASLAGMNFKVGWGGFGNDAFEQTAQARSAANAPSIATPGEVTMPARPRAVSLAAMGRPGDEDVARSWDINTALANMPSAGARDLGNKLLGEASLSEIDARLARSRALQDTSALDAAYQNADTTARPIVPTGNRTYASADAPALTPEQQRQMVLRSLPGHLRPAVEAQMLAMDAARSDQAIKQATFGLNLRKELAAEASNPLLGNASLTDAQGQPLTGAAVLERVSPAVRNQVTGILEGRQPLPTGTATKDPYWKSIIQIAQQVDPTFDAVNYNARANTRKDFTSGTSAKQINAINTVIGHLSDLADTGKQLGNGSMDWLNAIYNKLTPGGSKRGVAINNFETLREGVGNELMRVWRQVGAGTEKEIEDWKAQIGAAKSPQELRGAFQTIAGMLESKLSALDTQYKQGMGTDKVSAISPESRQKLDALAGSGGGMIRARDPQGKLHQAPVGTPLPAGWTVEK